MEWKDGKWQKPAGDLGADGKYYFDPAKMQNWREDSFNFIDPKNMATGLQNCVDVIFQQCSWLTWTRSNDAKRRAVCRKAGY